MVRRKRLKFYFGKKKVARLLLKLTYSNLFFSLMDRKGKIICFKSSGQGHLIFSRFLKKTIYNIDFLFKSILPFVKLYKLKRFVFTIQLGRPGRYVKRFVKLFQRRKMRIIKYKYYIPIAHNGVKGRHLRYKKSHRRRRKKKKRKR